MKKITSLFAFVLMVMTSINAQNIGIKGGLNLSTLAINKDQIEDSKTKPGFIFGLTNSSHFGLLYVQSELLYNRKGAEYMIIGAEVDADLDYLQVPVSVGVSLFGTPLYLYGGPYAAYLLKADYEYKDSNNAVIATYDSKEAFNSWDFGLQAGLNLTISTLSLDFRISRGLSDVERDDIVTTIQTFTKNETKNFNMELTAGIRF